MVVDEHCVAVGEGRLVGGHADSEAVDWILRKEGRKEKLSVSQWRWTDFSRTDCVIQIGPVQ